MDSEQALDAMMQALRDALVVLEPDNPNRPSVSQALRYAEESSRTRSRDLLRIAAAHLRLADADTGPRQTDALEAARRATTLALFEYASGAGANRPAPIPARGRELFLGR